MRPAETRPKGPERGWGSWEGSTEPLPHQLGCLGERCKLPQRGPGQSPGKFAFWNILGPQKSRQNGELAFESGGQQVNLGEGHVPPPAQRGSAPVDTVKCLHCVLAVAVAYAVICMDDARMLKLVIL